MAIAGERPESGVRIQIQRDKSRPDPPWSYAGAARLSDADFPLVVVVDAGGEVKVTLSRDPATGADPPADLAEKVRLIVRAAYRQAKSDGEPPPWRVVRWRSDPG